jgi:AcrR family transcriptional regulator
MPKNKPTALPAIETTRARVLAAAERLLAMDGADFSMRELAAAAELSFATPFNHFGSKVAIMQGLSAERIDRMTTRFAQSAPAGDVVTRVLSAMDIAAAVMLEAPAVNRAVMGALGAPTQESGDVSARSRALWSIALGNGEGLEPSMAKLACAILPEQLALAFRGVLSFWTAGEIADSLLKKRARVAAMALLLGFLPEREKAKLLRLLRAVE